MKYVFKFQIKNIYMKINIIKYISFSVFNFFIFKIYIYFFFYYIYQTFSQIFFKFQTKNLILLKKKL